MKCHPFFVFLLGLAAPSARAENLAPGVLLPVVASPWSDTEDAPPQAVAGKWDTIAEPQPGHYYLFHAETTGKKQGTSVYHSTNRDTFGLQDKNGDAMHLVITLPVLVADVQAQDGKWRLTARNPGAAKWQTAALKWQELEPLPKRAKNPAGIRVALFDDYGSFGKGVPRVSELLKDKPGIAVTLVKPPLIREGGLKGFDVVIFTGGSGSKQAATLGLLGREQVRRFVEAGGGYIGICAGNYLACDGFSWGVKILDAKTKSSKWARGEGDLKIEFTAKGREILGMPEGAQTIRYANGPVFDPAGVASIGDFEPLAYFRSEFAKNGSPVGAQINSPAMVAGAYGQGRVLCSSPHPEQQPGMEPLIEHAVRWVAGEQAPGDHP